MCTGSADFGLLCAELAEPNLLPSNDMVAFLEADWGLPAFDESQNLEM